MCGKAEERKSGRAGDRHATAALHAVNKKMCCISYSVFYIYNVLELARLLSFLLSLIHSFQPFVFQFISCSGYHLI